jgi:diacylglycerol kinase family enzyme
MMYMTDDSTHHRLRLAAVPAGSCCAAAILLHLPQGPDSEAQRMHHMSVTTSFDRPVPSRQPVPID